ncbi:unnamed protein product [Agarophyton chilense]|eukprot:gb/GEZJ01001935.1/.p1 GENE.gb/GEZJ01001935.1/~~gb/GEZJ01001935.1/.p1  ORF type:complete len:689 (+),score=89.04 gb/GEZJ01001935.1/:153-2069(+)
MDDQPVALHDAQSPLAVTPSPTSFKQQPPPSSSSPQSLASPHSARLPAPARLQASALEPHQQAASGADDAIADRAPRGAASGVSDDHHAAVDEQHSRSDRVLNIAVASSQMTHASQPSLPDMASDLQHDLQTVAHHALHVKPQPLPHPLSHPPPPTPAQLESQPTHVTETQLDEPPAQSAIEFSSATLHAQQAIVEAEQQQTQSIHTSHEIPSQEMIPSQSEPQLVQTDVTSATDSDMHHAEAVVHELQKSESQLDAHNVLSEEHASQLAHSSAFPTAAVAVSAPATITDFAVNKVVDDEHTRVANEFDPKGPQAPHQAISIAPRRVTEQSKRGSERYHASGEQLKTLVSAFEHNPTPDASTLTYLSEAIGMPMHNLVLWFKNRRARHKRSHINQMARGGKRSYVKSGIYSRHKRVKHSHRQPAPATVPPGGLTLPLSHGLTSISSPLAVSSIALPTVDPKIPAIAVAGRDAEELVKTGAPQPSRMKRPRFSAVPELVGDDNPCQGWTSEECHRRCLAFFERTTSITCPEQSKLVENVSSEFFLSELQSGLTLVSAMQPLETSVGVLDAIMEKLPAQGPRLSSGSKVLMREFLARIRTGSAEQFVLIEGATDAAETMAESHGSVVQDVVPNASSAGEQ